jgi:hypothetical protein
MSDCRKGIDRLELRLLEGPEKVRQEEAVRSVAN